ncbi:hypothetical protein CMV_019250 [Castanea mollissima]|uniref:Pentatricopeptide repeat-containing protein n=1 Tax=Castanea mollissima TaxID=60419 RepID=A0A8J4QQI6_9ROSI|nr:hypothetical protein CMV_019250 [Castanea mollissima]
MRLSLILSNSSSVPNHSHLVLSILSETDHSNMHRTISTVNILIGFFGNSEDLDLCISLIGKWKLSMNPYTYKCLLQAYLRSYDSDKAFGVYNEMRRRGHTLDIFAYNMLLDALAKDQKNCDRLNRLTRALSKLGHASEAHRLFCNMWNFHDKGDRDACRSMLESLCNAALGKLKQISHLHDLFEKMKQDGPSPDIFTYNILISSFGRAGKVEAIKIFEELENSNCKADIVSYNSLINCVGKNGDLDEAHMRFKEMQEKGFTPDVVTYNTLIECFGKTDKVEMAWRLFDEMLAEGC